MDNVYTADSITFQFANVSNTWHCSCGRRLVPLRIAGKVVAVVGTGSSATQIVPAIQPAVRQLYVFQREPGWIMPKGERDFTSDDRAAFARPWRRRRERWRQRYLLERSLWRGHLYRPGAKTNEARRQFCLSYIDRRFADRPDLREAVTPTYPYPGKRPIFASTFYPALTKENVELVPRAVASVTRTGIVDADGSERAVDVIVMATGFQAANYLARVRVTGRGGRTLDDHWAGEPRAYLGITVPGFPNFFMIYGPGTNGGEIVTMLESQAEYAVRAVKRMIGERVTAIEVKRGFEARWHRWLQSTMAGTSWTMSKNYFTSPSGKVVTQWPYGNVLYRVLTKLLGRVSETTRRRRRADRTEQGTRVSMTHPFSYEGLHVVVTGAASGVGAALLELLAELDVARVTAIDRNEPSGSLDVFIGADLSDEHAVRDGVMRIDGPVNALFNNAGVADTQPPDIVLSVNYLALRALSEGIADRMPAGSAIVNTASTAGGLWRKRAKEITSLLDLDIGGGWDAAGSGSSRTGGRSARRRTTSRRRSWWCTPFAPRVRRCETVCARMPSVPGRSTRRCFRNSARRRATRSSTGTSGRWAGARSAPARLR